MQNINPTYLVELLGTTLMGKTEEIQTAEKKLKDLYRDESFLPNLMLVPKDKSLPYNLRKAAVVYTLVYVKSNLDLQKNEEGIIWVCTFLFSQLSDQVLEISLKKHIISSILFLAPFDKSIRLKSLLYQECLRQPELSNNSNTVIDRIIFIGLAIQTILSISVHITKEFTEFIRNSFVGFVEIQHNLLIHANNAIQSERRESIIEIYQVLKIYSYSFKLYFRKIAYADIETLKLLFKTETSKALSYIWDFSLPNNSIATQVIYYTHNQDNEIVEHHHNVKSDYVQCLTLMLRSIFQYFKNPETVNSHPLISSSDLIPILINSLRSISIVVPYYKIKSNSLIRLIEEIMNCLILTLKTSYYYYNFKMLKDELLQGVLFKLLEIENKESYENFIDDPSEFINEIMQIVDMDPTDFIRKKKNETDIMEETDEIEDYTTLKTVAATLLSQLCKTVDGTLVETVNYIQMFLKSKEKTEFSKSTMLLILGILRDQISERPIEANNILLALTEKLNNSEIPRSLVDLNSCPPELKQENIEYLMTMIVIQKFLLKIKEVDSSVLPVLYKTICTLICSLEYSENVEEGLKIMAYDLITVLVNRDSENRYCLSFIKIINGSVVSPFNSNTVRQLDVLYNLYKYKDDEARESVEIVLETLESLDIVIEKEMHKNKLGDKTIINKCWNVICDISSNELLSKKPEIRMKIENILLKISQYMCSGTNSEENLLEYDDHFLTCFNSLIEIGEIVTLPQIQIFSVIPYLFYNKYEKKFEETFESIILLMKYGHNVILADQSIVKVIIEMAFASITEKKKGNESEIEKCKGAIIIQNFIILYGHIVPNDMWLTIGGELTKLTSQLKYEDNRLLHPKEIFNYCSLVACIALTLTFAHQFFSQDDNNIMLNEIILNKTTLAFENVGKIVVTSLSEFIVKIDQEFILNRLTNLIETILDILEEINNRDQDNIPKEYSNCLDKSKNKITSINETDHFKAKIEELKKRSPQSLLALSRELPDPKLAQLRKVLTTINVNNESRPMFKIKRN